MRNLKSNWWKFLKGTEQHTKHHASKARTRREEMDYQVWRPDFTIWVTAQASHEAVSNSLFSRINAWVFICFCGDGGFTIMSSGQRNITTVIMISDSSYFRSSNNTENTVGANSHINTSECFILANYQGIFMGSHIKNVTELLRMLFFLAWCEEKSNAKSLWVIKWRWEWLKNHYSSLPMSQKLPCIWGLSFPLQAIHLHQPTI